MTVLAGLQFNKIRFGQGKNICGYQYVVKQFVKQETICTVILLVSVI